MAGAYVRYLLAAVERAAASEDEVGKKLAGALEDQPPVWASSIEAPEPPTTEELVKLGKLARWLDEQAGTTPPSFQKSYDLIKESR